MSKFTKIVGFKPLPDGKCWVLLEPLVYYETVKGFDEIVVPAGFITDFASVPKPLQCFVGRWGKHGNAAVVHDWLYYKKTKTRKEADRVFLDAMKVLGVGWVKRHLIYYAVRLFGWWAWKHNRRGVLNLKRYKLSKVTEW